MKKKVFAVVILIMLLCPLEAHATNSTLPHTPVFCNLTTNLLNYGNLAKGQIKVLSTTFKNCGTANLTFRATSGHIWDSVQNPIGKVSPGGISTLTLSIDESALPATFPGFYTDIFTLVTNAGTYTVNVVVGHVYGYHNPDDIATITSLNAQITTLTSQLDTAKSSITTLNAQVAALTSQLDTANSNITTLNTQITDITNQLAYWKNKASVYKHLVQVGYELDVTQNYTKNIRILANTSYGFGYGIYGSNSDVTCTPSYSLPDVLSGIDSNFFLPKNEEEFFILNVDARTLNAGDSSTVVLTVTCKNPTNQEIINTGTDTITITAIAPS